MSLFAIEEALDLPPAGPAPLLTGEGALPSAFAVTDLAAESVTAVGLAVADLLQRQGDARPAVTVDRRLASFWFASSIRPQGWQLPPSWDPLAGDYPGRDGWIRLHTNAPAHRAAVERVVGACADRPALAAHVAGWAVEALEQAVVEAGGCAAVMRDAAAWRAQPQGRALQDEPLIAWTTTGEGPRRAWPGTPERPLAGLRVLDLTRVLAGPVASRTLAGLGAQVLRIDPPGWDEPGLVPDVTLGKRCARLDLRQTADRATFEALLGQADLLLHGYRADALERLGYDEARCQTLAPGLIDVALNAYGWTGPWRNRRGFDSLVQMSTGIAAAGMAWRQAAQPVPLPVQALDHATGYLMAAAAIRALAKRREDGLGASARLSLARTARLLVERSAPAGAVSLAEETEADLDPAVERGAWGEARRLASPLRVGDRSLHWSLPACPLGSHPAAWC
ncbi:CoA transferase [Pseudomonas mangiferae]|uniref:Acyl-CoA transferase n=1 Tax=Pseudomonas mangiferae TaxID=2593654 RepID=A0A553GWS9_9PSED|nr:CoA transferase [Pseudomonas mangiferae]TRX73933.1 acyl-CoA transferase [Pseudomonas mangiferae]